MTPLEQFDIEDSARFEILARKLNLREELVCGADEKGLVLNYVRERDARRDAMMREELLGRMPKMNDIANRFKEPISDKEAGFIVGFATAKVEITSIITDIWKPL